MGRNSQALTLMLKLLLRGEFGHPRRLAVSIIVLSILFILSFTNTALIGLEQRVQDNISSKDIVLETIINSSRLVLVCGDINLYNVNYTPVRLNISLFNSSNCYNISTITVCSVDCNKRDIMVEVFNRSNGSKVIYNGITSVLIENFIKSYNSIFNVLYYVILVMFLLGTGGVSYGFATSIREKWVKINYWFSALKAIIIMSLVFSLYIVVVSMSLGTILLYSILLLLSFITSTPYIRPMPDIYSILIALTVSYATILIGLRIGAKTS